MKHAKCTVKLISIEGIKVETIFTLNKKRLKVLFGSFLVAIIWILLLIEPQNMIQNVFSRNNADCFSVAQD